MKFFLDTYIYFDYISFVLFPRISFGDAMHSLSREAVAVFARMQWAKE